MSRTESAARNQKMHDLLKLFLARVGDAGIVDRTDLKIGSRVWALATGRQATVFVDPHAGLTLSKSDHAGQPTWSDEERAALQPICDEINATLTVAGQGGMGPDERANWNSSGYSTGSNTIQW